jgi:hypothetical protein
MADLRGSIHSALAWLFPPLPKTGGPAWTELALLALLMALAVQASFSPVWDPDSFWELAIGRETWLAGHPLRSETLSFTAVGKPWMDVSWLFNVAAYALWRVGGFEALQWAVALGGAAVIAALYRAVRAGGGDALSLACYLLVALPALSSRIRLRPELLSMLFLALLLERIERWTSGKEAPARSWPFIALLFALWAQCHGGWTYGWLALGTVLGGLALDERAAGVPWIDRRLAALGVPLAAAVGGVLLNPYGWRILTFPFENFVSLLDRSLPVIFEWQHTPLTLAAAPSLAFFVLVLLATVFPVKRIRWADLLFATSQVFLAFWWERYWSFAALALAPLACRKMVPLLKAGLTRKVILASASILFAIRVVSIVMQPPLPWSMAGNYPAEEIRFLNDHKVPGNVFHTFVAGGFVEWEYAPLGKAYMDGRLIFLPELRAYLKAKRDPAALKAFVLSRPFTVAIVPHAAAPQPSAGQSPGRSPNDDVFAPEEWALVYFGDYGCVYLKRIPAYEPMIQRYEFRALRPNDNDHLRWACRAGKADPGEIISEIHRAVEQQPLVAQTLGLPDLERDLSTSIPVEGDLTKPETSPSGTKPGRGS